MGCSKSDEEVLSFCTCGPDGKTRIQEINREISRLKEDREALKVVFSERKVALQSPAE